MSSVTNTPAAAPDAPLAGVRVLDLSRLLPGPYCTLVLADLGCAVDKLEDPHAGDYLRIFPSTWPPRSADTSGKFLALNRDKRSLVLDLKHEEGRRTLLRLLPRYDVLVESFRPGVMDRLGLGWEALSAGNPRLVVCAISGYPKDGPYRERAAHDLNTVGLAGVLGLSGPSGGVPAVPPVQLADLGSGLVAATAIVAALYAAQRSGRGRRVDVSMSESVFGFAVPALGDLAAAGDLPPRGGDLLTGGAACYGVYRTMDDRLLTVAPLEPKFWEVFCRTLGRACDPSELIASAEAQQRVREEIQAILSTKTRDEWTAIFAGVDACCEPVLAPEELADHPLHRDAFIELDGARYPKSAVAHLGGRATHTRAPTQGQHSDEILREGGYTAAEIAALRSAGVTR